MIVIMVMMMMMSMTLATKILQSLDRAFSYCATRSVLCGAGNEAKWYTMRFRWPIILCITDEWPTPQTSSGALQPLNGHPKCVRNPCGWTLRFFAVLIGSIATATSSLAETSSLGEVGWQGQPSAQFPICSLSAVRSSITPTDAQVTGEQTAASMSSKLTPSSWIVECRGNSMILDLASTAASIMCFV